MKIVLNIFAAVMILTLSGCGTTDGALQDQGQSYAYIQGFHDGRHSGMSEEGNQFEHYIRDQARFVEDTDYKAGWLAGESEGKKLQEQAMSVGNAIGGVYSETQINKEVKKQQDFDKIGKDALKDVDTSVLEK